MAPAVTQNVLRPRQRKTSMPSAQPAFLAWRFGAVVSDGSAQQALAGVLSMAFDLQQAHVLAGGVASVCWSRSRGDCQPQFADDSA